MKPVRVGLCGLGTVGSGVVNVLTRNASLISNRAGCEIVLSQIGARRDNLECDISVLNVTRDIFDVVNNPNVDIVVELIGGVDIARDLVLKAIENGKHVVTANKALIAEFGNEIFSLAKARGVTVAFEAAVAGGIPIVKAMREGLAANKIEWLAGIINGTGNFILTEMQEKGREFSDVLLEAQALGYAEADPTFDVEGIDAAHKLVILASLAFGIPLQMDKVFTEGISKIEPIDVVYAKELGYSIKHIGITRRSGAGIELRVHPTLISDRCLLANVNGVMNAVMVNCDAVGTTLYYGPGAGAEPTASSVIADIVDIARTLSAAPENRVPFTGFTHTSNEAVLPIDEAQTAYYLRMSAKDEPGVLSQVATILSDFGISVEALIQKEALEGEKTVPLIFLTNKAVEKYLIVAIAKIECLQSIVSPITSIRLESLT